LGAANCACAETADTSNIARNAAERRLSIETSIANCARRTGKSFGPAFIALLRISPRSNQSSSGIG
jgi:hypothetical protein